MTALDQELSHQKYSIFLVLKKSKDLTKLVSDQAHVWLRKQNRSIDLDFNENHFERNGSEELLFVTSDSSDGYAWRLRYTHSREGQKWQTDMAFRDGPKDDSWISIVVSTDSNIKPARPKIVDFLVESGVAVDAGVVLSPTPRVLNSSHIPDLIEQLGNPLRRNVMFTAATDEQMDFEAFYRKISTWTAGTKGRGDVAVLDPIATREFAQIVGQDFSVPAGTIRTYMPNATLDDSYDSRRHRISGREYLKRTPKSVAATFTWIADENSKTGSGTRQANQILRRLQREQDSYLLSLVTSEKPPQELAVEAPPKGTKTADESHRTAGSAIEISELEAFKALVRNKLGLLDLTEDALDAYASKSEFSREGRQAMDALKAQLEERAQEVQRLREEHEDYRLLEEERELDDAISDEQFQKLERELRAALKRAAYFENIANRQEYTEYVEEAEENAPSSWSELISYLKGAASRGIIFTGQDEDAEELWKYDNLNQSLNLCWSAIRALIAYRESRVAGSFTGDMNSYLLDGYALKQGVSFPAGKHAKGETGHTKTNYVRTFPVPKEINSSGQQSMYSHFKLGGTMPNRPTLYYFDDSTKSGLIAIGYIGRHLKNRLTN